MAFNKNKIRDITKHYKLERIGHLYYWQKLEKARFIAEVTCLVLLICGIASYLLRMLAFENLHLDEQNQYWASVYAFAFIGVFLVIRVVAGLMSERSAYAKLPLFANMISLALCLPLLFSTIGMFDGFCWLLLFVYAAVGFVVLEPRYIVATQLGTLFVMIAITFNHDIFPYRVRAYMVGIDTFMDTLSTADMIFKWVLMSFSSLLGMSILAYLTAVWRQREEDLRVISNKDELTGLMNRRSIMQFLQRELINSANLGRPLSIAMVDLDLFKGINDTYGHPFGDKALKLVAHNASAMSRKDDAVGRIGGEEFLLVFPNCSAHHARNNINRLRETLLTKALDTGKGDKVVIRLSAGVTEFVNEQDDDLALLKRADDALYLAKEKGRDRVEIASQYEVPS